MPSRNPSGSNPACVAPSLLRAALAAMALGMLAAAIFLP
jgi:hypothetical protein